MITARHIPVMVRALVLSSAVALMLPGAWGHSVTVVEFAQLPAGLAAWQRQSLGIYRVCGPVSKLLYALPVHLAGIRVDYPISFDSDIRSRPEWEVGRIFQKQNYERYHNIYRWSRLLPILITILGGCLICEWSTQLFGPRPGIVSLCLWCWMPPILAHGSLVTSDMAAAVLLLLAARTFWAFLLRPGLPRALVAGIALGLAETTKFTLLILTPCWIVFLVGRAIQLRSIRLDVPTSQRDTSVRFLVLGSVVLFISVIVINSMYGFQEVGHPLADWQSGWSSLARDLQSLRESRAATWLLNAPLPISLEYFRGLDYQLADTERAQSAYLFGRTKLGGWWYWYAVAAFIKVPLPALVLLGLSTLRLPAALRGRDSMFWACLCLLVPATEAALTIAVTTGTGTNAALRYMLPSLALLCVWGGRASNAHSRFGRVSTIGLLAWLWINAIIGLPDLIGWQNEAGWAWRRWSGQPALIGDSLDWGQDLTRLSAWVNRRERNASTLICAYGLGDGEPYGLKPPMVRPTSGPGGHPFYLAVSENILFGYQVGSCISVAGSQSSLSHEQREALLRLEPYARVGRTIRIYRLHDLPPHSSLKDSSETIHPQGRGMSKVMDGQLSGGGLFLGAVNKDNSLHNLCQQRRIVQQEQLY